MLAVTVTKPVFLAFRLNFEWLSAEFLDLCAIGN